MSIHPQVIEKEGKKEFVILPYEEFLQIQEALEDLDDIRIIRDERNSTASKPTKSLDDILLEIDE
ncbi:MAG: type II toxin-antitoxin system Phd/YefM family antitoxin [Chthoniobacterales bacterium]